MQKIEITVSPDYVAKWTIVDAVRELLQNAIDAKTAGHDMHVIYHENTDELVIISEGAKLDIASLLLGSTSKANDAASIGQFGEGYKIATLVLLRNNKTITFENGPAKETWHPRFIKSRRFGCNVLGFFIEKWAPFTPAKDNLVITVQGITNEEYNEQIVPSALCLRSDWNILETTMFGDIINIPGAVFVNGLFVKQHEPYKYGYNFKPQFLSLDRDRKLVSDFDLEWLASRMWSKSSNTDEVLELIEKNAADTRYIASVNGSTTLATAAWEKFIKEYGKNAVPVTTQEELERISSKYRPVIVHSGMYGLITSCSRYEAPTEEDEESLADRFIQWFGNYAIAGSIPSYATDEFKTLVDEVRDLE